MKKIYNPILCISLFYLSSIGQINSLSAQSIPPLSPNCTPTTTSFASTAPVGIPSGPAVVSSTITVSGAGTYITDVNMITNITHTFSADMDITLMSPSGTVITISTDNGAGNDNTFNGTTWDDDANPSGTVPYTNNNSLISDHAFVNNTAATPAVPEEHLSAFIGEDPNGTWTLTISDDLSGDGGSIDSWSLVITTHPNTSIIKSAVQTFTNSTSTPIADNNITTSTLNISGLDSYLFDIDLTTFITHTNCMDLDITLTSPAGTTVTITTDNGANNDNVFNGTIWNDNANPAGQVPYPTNDGLVTDHAYIDLTLASPLVPEESLGAFIGENPNGTWTITISDDMATETGTLASWALGIITAQASLPNTIVNTTGLVLTSPETGATFQWLNCATSNSVISSATHSSYTGIHNGNYSVEVSKNGCVDTSACYVTTLTTTDIINSIQYKESVLIHPNPSLGIFNLELDGASKVIITNSVGQVIYQKNINEGSHTIDLEKESNGMYNLTIIGNNNKIKNTWFSIMK